MVRRFRYAAALAAVGVVTSAGSASAHHCYKDEWTAAAYANVANGTAWMTFSDLGTMFMVAPEDVGRCGPAVDRAVAEWMASQDLTVEPLIHGKAVVGGGAFHTKGKAPKPFEYLTNDDFETVIGFSKTYLAESGCPVPEL